MLNSLCEPAENKMLGLPKIIHPYALVAKALLRLLPVQGLEVGE